jgi:hypothetical protein
LEYIGSKLRTPVAKADYERMSKENIDAELVAKYRAKLESTRVPPAKAKADYEQFLAEEAAAKQAEAKKQPVDGK